MSYLYYCYWQVGLAVVNGQLMAIGGFDGTTYLKTIEVYDPEQNCWKLCGGMNYRRLGGGVGVVRMPHNEPHLWWLAWGRKDRGQGHNKEVASHPGQSSMSQNVNHLKPDIWAME